MEIVFHVFLANLLCSHLQISPGVISHLRVYCYLKNNKFIFCYGEKSYILIKGPPVPTFPLLRTSLLVLLTLEDQQLSIARPQNTNKSLFAFANNRFLAYNQLIQAEHMIEFHMQSAIRLVRLPWKYIISTKPISSPKGISHLRTISDRNRKITCLPLRTRYTQIYYHQFLFSSR